jgi:hypothetical protein
MSAEHKEILAAIQACDDLDSPEARELLHVYADHLQAAGDPRGTLAALQLQQREGEAARAWLADHREEIFGPLAGVVGDSRGWCGGWLTEVRISSPPPDIWVKQKIEELPDLATLLRLPVCACVRRLEAYLQEWPNEPDLPGRASLRMLGIKGSTHGTLALGELPRLEHLVLAGCPTELAVAAPRLRELGFVEAHLPAIPKILDSAPSVERLSIQLSWHWTTATDLRELLNHPTIGSLRELQLTMAEHWNQDLLIQPPVPEDWIDVLLEAPLLRRIEVRKFLVSPFADQCRRLHEGFASAPGETLLLVDAKKLSEDKPSPAVSRPGRFTLRAIRDWFTRR